MNFLTNEDSSNNVVCCKIIFTKKKLLGPKLFLCVQNIYIYIFNFVIAGQKSPQHPSVGLFWGFKPRVLQSWGKTNALLFGKLRHHRPILGTDKQTNKQTPMATLWADSVKICNYTSDQTGLTLWFQFLSICLFFNSCLSLGATTYKQTKNIKNHILHAGEANQSQIILI